MNDGYSVLNETIVYSKTHILLDNDYRAQLHVSIEKAIDDGTWAISFFDQPGSLNTQFTVTGPKKVLLDALMELASELEQSHWDDPGWVSNL